MGNTLLQNDSRPQDKPRNIRPIMLRFLFALILAVSAASAVAEQGRRPDRQQDGRQQDGRQMSREERQRMRDDVRDAYRNDRQDRQQQPQKTRQMSPEERGQLRRDIEDANREMKR
jgi:hypothetical protein